MNSIVLASDLAGETLRGISIAEGCRLMGIARSTFYDRPTVSLDDTALAEQMVAISDRFEARLSPHAGCAAPAELRCEPQKAATPDAGALAGLDGFFGSQSLNGYGMCLVPDKPKRIGKNRVLVGFPTDPLEYFP
jgi:hypothetical protein